MSVMDSSNPRNLLKAREDHSDDGRNTLAGLTLAAVLSGENRHAPTRTLLNIIREEESGAAYRGLVSHHQNKKSWKSFKDRHRDASASASASVQDCGIQSSAARNTQNSAPIAIAGDTIPSPVVIRPENVSHVNATSPIVPEFPTPTSPANEPVVVRLSAALEAEREAQAPDDISPAPATADEGARVSLMSLQLMERQRKEHDKGEDDVAEGGREYVCTVRQKGAAFHTFSGHTFCRLCSRELWASRANCPLCKAYIWRFFVSSKSIIQTN